MNAPDPLPPFDPNAPRPGGITRHLETTNAMAEKQMMLIDQMITWQLANPGKPWTQCAQTLGLSVIWCRMVASTDAYKSRAASVRDTMLREVGMMGLREKINAAAEVVVERMAEKAAVSESMGDLTDAAEVLLGQMYGKNGGVAPAAAPPTQVTVQTQIILEAREKLLAGTQQLPPPEPQT